jgi:putative oxidoreductase
VTVAESLARPLLAGTFVYGGLDALRHAPTKVDVAQPILGPLSAATGLSPERLVAVNGGVQIVAGVALAAGILPRTAAAVLALSLVPTTFGGHRFWEQSDEQGKRTNVLHFLKNASALGGLILAATSTGGRPSVPWRARQVAGRAVATTTGALSRD